MSIYSIFEICIFILSVCKYYICFLSRFSYYKDNNEKIQIYNSHLINPPKNSLNDKMKLYLNNYYLKNNSPFHTINFNLENSNNTQIRYLKNIKILNNNKQYYEIELKYHYYDLIPNEKIPSNLRLTLIQCLFMFLFAFNSLLLINDNFITKYKIIPFKINLYILGILLNILVGLIYLEYTLIQINNDKNSNLFIYITALILSFSSIIKYCVLSWGKIIDINYDIKVINYKDVYDFFKNNLFMDFFIPFVTDIKKAMEKPSFIKISYKELFFEIGIIILILVNFYFVKTITRKINLTQGFLIFSRNRNTELILSLEIKKNKINKHFQMNLFHLVFNLIYFFIKKEYIIDDITIFENIFFYVQLCLIYHPIPLPNSYFMDLKIIYANFKVIFKSNLICNFKANSNFKINKKELNECLTYKKPILILNPYFSNNEKNSNNILNQCHIGILNTN